MDENKKRNLLIILSVACITIALVFAYSSLNGGKTNSTGSDELITMKCRNPECRESFEIPTNEFNSYMQKNAGVELELPAYPCQKCEEKSAYRIFK